MSAPTLFALSASPHSLKYIYSAGGAPGFFSKSRADVIADAAAGPLRELLGQASSASKWVALPKGPSLSIYVTGTANTSATDDPPACTVNYVVPTQPFAAYFACSPLALRVEGGDGFCIVELRFHHSVVR